MRFDKTQVVIENKLSLRVVPEDIKINKNTVILVQKIVTDTWNPLIIKMKPQVQLTASRYC